MRTLSFVWAEAFSDAVHCTLMPQFVSDCIDMTQRCDLKSHHDLEYKLHHFYS